ncbi:hypothetical protein E2C01_027629 [Portunus trituberculatus]|uniref:Uncharacterized protein n=1 Tax=Portunus trituberculatus TaxID=210409 RepID=A0A5B7ELE1_PORTR|nr:hypothetical protein [Portunus trituberculatus]
MCHSCTRNTSADYGDRKEEIEEDMRKELGENFTRIIDKNSTHSHQEQTDDGEVNTEASTG